MNKKIIWGVIVLILIATGIYFYSLNAKTNYIDSEAQLQLVTTTYKGNGFEFKYPKEWILHSDSDNGAIVLTKEHEAHNTNDPLNGSTVDFSVYACNLSDKSCSKSKEDLDQAISVYSDGGKNDLTLKIDGVKGSQWVNGADQYSYNGVIVKDNILYKFSSTPEDYNMKYPNVSDKQVKAIFDSFRFISPLTQSQSSFKTLSLKGGETVKIGDSVKIILDKAINQSNVKVMIVAGKVESGHYTNNGSMSTTRGYVIYEGKNNGLVDWMVPGEYPGEGRWLLRLEDNDGTVVYSVTPFTIIN